MTKERNGAREKHESRLMPLKFLMTRTSNAIKAGAFYLALAHGTIFNSPLHAAPIETGTTEREGRAITRRITLESDKEVFTILICMHAGKCMYIKPHNVKETQRTVKFSIYSVVSAILGYISPENLEDISKITFIHTHPQKVINKMCDLYASQTSYECANQTGRVAPPSVVDILEMLERRETTASAIFKPTRRDILYSNGIGDTHLKIEYEIEDPFGRWVVRKINSVASFKKNEEIKEILLQLRILYAHIIPRSGAYKTPKELLAKERYAMEEIKRLCYELGLSVEYIPYTDIRYNE